MEPQREHGGVLDSADSVVEGHGHGSGLAAQSHHVQPRSGGRNGASDRAGGQFVDGRRRGPVVVRLFGLIARRPIKDQEVRHQGSAEERDGRGRRGMAGLELRGGILQDEPKEGDAPVDAKDDEGPDVEFRHKDTDGHGPAPQEAAAADGRDDALVAAKVDRVLVTDGVVRVALFRLAGRGGHRQDERRQRNGHAGQDQLSDGQSDGHGRHFRAEKAVLVDEARLEEERRKRLQVDLDGRTEKINIVKNRSRGLWINFCTWTNRRRANSRRSVRS